MTVMRLSSLVSRCESSEQILLMRLLKQVLVLSQMPLKNMIDAKSSSKSWIFSLGSYRCRMFRISSFFALFISSASRMISSLREMMPLMSRPNCCTRTVYISMISAQISSILLLERPVISSMKSRMASLADSERMFWMCLLFTNCISLMTFRMPRSPSLAQNWLFPARPACLKSRMRFLNMRKSMKSRSSSLKRNPFQFFSWIIFRISLWQSSTEWSGSARLMMRQHPSLMSSKVLKERCRFLISLGNLSALASLIWLSSMMRTSLTFWQMSRSRWTKKELEISYSSPLLSLKPGQSQKAMSSITTFVGTDVSEYFSWPILILEALALSKVGLRPSYRTTRLLPERKDMIVLLPTPVSPITRTLCGVYLSTGIAYRPLWIRALSLGRSMGFDSVIIQIIDRIIPSSISSPPVSPRMSPLIWVVQSHQGDSLGGKWEVTAVFEISLAYQIDRTDRVRPSILPEASQDLYQFLLPQLKHAH